MKTSVFDKLTTIFAVTAITLLVWLWAEGRNIKEYNETVKIQFVSAQSGQKIWFDPGETSVDVRYRASRGEDSALKSSLRRDGGVVEVPVSIGEDSVSLKNKLQANVLFEKYAINIDSTTPDTIPLDVVPLVTKEVPVEVATNGGVRIENTTVEPGVVAVTLPEHYASGINQVSAYLQPEDYRNAEVNVPQSANVTTSLSNSNIPASQVEIQPEFVKVNYTVRNQTESLILPSVPIVVSAAPSIMQGRELLLPENQQVLQDVELEGPKDVIDMVRRGERRVVVEIRPRPAELESGGWNASLHLVKPDQVRLVSPNPLPQIPVKVIPKDGGTAPGGGLSGVLSNN